MKENKKRTDTVKATKRTAIITYAAIDFSTTPPSVTEHTERLDGDRLSAASADKWLRESGKVGKVTNVTFEQTAYEMTREEFFKHATAMKGDK